MGKELTFSLMLRAEMGPSIGKNTPNTNPIYLLLMASIELFIISIHWLHLV